MAFKEIYIESSASGVLSLTTAIIIPNSPPPPGRQDPPSYLKNSAQLVT